MLRVRPRPGIGVAGLALLAALVGALVLAGSAAAHALPQSSSPSPGQVLQTAPKTITITFGERPDPALSSIDVLDAHGASVAAGPASASSTDPLTLQVAVTPLPAGVYTVSWRTVSAVDGHRATGSFSFGVGVAPSAASGASTVSAGPSPAAIIARWLLYLGLIGSLGAAVFAASIGEVRPTILRPLLLISWLVAAFGTVAVIVVGLVEAGVGPGEVLGTSFWPEIVERTVPLVVAGIATLVAVRSERPSRAALAIIAFAAAGAMLADVLGSHAAAGSTPGLDVIVQTLHILAVGLWIGGLACLLLVIRRRPADEASAITAARFSRLATIGIAVVAITGLLRAISEIGTLDALVSTDFGRLVLAKTALLGVIAGLGAINRFRNVPAARRSLTGLRRVGSVEVLVAATVVLLAATLVNVAPPAAASAGGPSPSPSPTPPPLVLDGADFATTVRLRLEVAPGLTGVNTFRATVTDFDTGQPIAADGVTLRFALPERPDVGGSRLDLPSIGDGVFSATGANLSIDGVWSVTAVVARGSDSVEVPLTIPILSQVLPVDVSRSAGSPTIYTVHLPAGETVQVYLDPDQPGQNDVHVTFFDAAGTELPATGIGVTVVSAGSPARNLTVRTLEPGHVVGTLDVDAASHTFVITATSPAGEPLRAQLQISPGS